MHSSSVLIIALMIPHAAAQVRDSTSVETRMYAVERLDQHSPRQFAALRQADRRAALACRDTLLAVLKGVTTKSDLRPYLTPELRIWQRV